MMQKHSDSVDLHQGNSGLESICGVRIRTLELDKLQNFFGNFLVERWNFQEDQISFSRTPTIFLVAKLEWLSLLMVYQFWQKLFSFCHNSCVWRTDRRTDVRLYPG